MEQEGIARTRKSNPLPKQEIQTVLLLESALLQIGFGPTFPTTTADAATTTLRENEKRKQKKNLAALDSSSFTLDSHGQVEDPKRVKQLSHSN